MAKVYFIAGMRRHTAGQGIGAAQVIVLLALLLPVVLGAMALAIDIGIFYLEWAQLQRAADAAALAGASQLPQNPNQAILVARSYAQKNGTPPGEITSASVASNNQTITITLTRSVPYHFGAVLGLARSPVLVSATAGLQTAGSAIGTLPVGIDSRTTYSFGQQITLMQGSSPYGPGNWGALALGGSGASNFASNVVNGYSGTVSVGDLLTTETGKMSGQVKSSFDQRINAGLTADPTGTPSSHALGDARVATVAMVDFANINGKSQVPVLGFAEIWLVGIDNQLGIKAIFIQQITPGGQPSPGGTNYGAYKVVLVQ